MAKKKSSTSTVKAESIVAPVETTNKNLIYAMLLCIAATCLVYIGALQCGFVNYDDELYIKNNILLHSLSGSNLYTIFFTSKGIYGGNYHPLVTLTNAIEYQLVGYEPYLYHLVNILLHLANTALVFLLVNTITNKNIFVSTFVALFFGIHPMHVESVVWISERKDVLYAFFYLLSVLFYLRYEQENKKSMYLVSILCFVLSLMSKSMAVTLPLILFAIHYYKKENIEKSFFIKTIPFWLLSLGTGLLAIYSQKMQGYIGAYDFSMVDKFFMASYSWAYYIKQLFVPMHMSVLHPFPQNGLDSIFYISPLVWIGFVFLLYKFPSYRKLVLFGLLFYTFSIVVVLQFIAVGAAVVSERYTYLAYIGLFFILAVWLEKYWQSKRNVVLSLCILAAIGFSFASIQRIKVWEDGETLWRDATSKYPATADYAWFGLANILKEKKANPKEIIEAYNKATTINNKFPNYYLNGSTAKGEFGDKQGAINDLTKALALNPNYVEALYNRGIMYVEMQQPKPAIADYTRAIQLKPDHLEAYFNRAIAYKANQEYLLAINDYQQVLKMNPKFINAYTNLGNVYLTLQQYDKAIQVYNQGISLDNKQSVLYLNRGVAYLSLNQNQFACADFKMAAELGDTKAQQAVKDMCK